MNYLISRQYVRDKPVYFGIFSSLHFAREMINIKVQQDQTTNLKIIYRIYYDDEIIYEYDKWHSRAPDQTTHHRPSFKFKLYQVQSKKEITIIAELDELADANEFIRCRLDNDAKNNADITYRLYQYSQFLSEHSQATHNEEQAKANSDKTNALAFHPTPLPTTPAPGPRTYLIHPKKEDDEEDKG